MYPCAPDSLQDGVAQVGQGGSQSPGSAVSCVSHASCAWSPCSHIPQNDAPLLPHLACNPLRLREVLMTEAEPEPPTHRFLSMRQTPVSSARPGLGTQDPAATVRRDKVVAVCQALGHISGAH